MNLCFNPVGTTYIVVSQKLKNNVFYFPQLEDDMESLDRSGVKNQSQTLALCRAMVRAKRTSARAALLALLAMADLPCRRLFLDYRGLRLLAPWCQDADATFRYTGVCRLAFFLFVQIWTFEAHEEPICRKVH